MSGDITNVQPGDTLTLTIKGTVATPDKAGTAEGTTLKIYRPAAASLVAAHLLPRDVRAGVRVDTVFTSDAVVSFDVSKIKSGVWIDEAGRYWMRRPEGWFEMSVEKTPVRLSFGGQFTPQGATRLTEDRET